jgi:long-subunit fatty acid transport protein
MATERWDIEANAVVYFNSVSDQVLFTSNTAKLDLVEAQARPNGSVVNAHIPSYVGNCTKYDASHTCVGSWEVPTQLKGKDQLSLRIGGDYNVLPGRFAVRAGASFETDGADVRYLNIRNYMLGRAGLHAGLTFRIAGKTDFSVGFAHFIQKDIRLDVNPDTPLPPSYTATPAAQAKYNYVPGTHDGVAMLTIAQAPNQRPNYQNAGNFFYHLEVVSVSLSQHF